jgi:5-methylcytosine-specific restriction endonuclease McrA
VREHPRGVADFMGVDVPEFTGPCEECGVTITRTRKAGPPPKFCGGTCQVKAWARANPDRYKALSDAGTARARARTAAEKPGCRICGSRIPLGQKFLCGDIACKRRHRNAMNKQFRDALKEATGRSYYPGSTKAALRRRRARRRGVESEEFLDIEIFERDKWKCQICRRRVRRDVKYPHPLFPTIDHIIPLSQGGPHARANVRLACWHCNHHRGNRGGSEQLMLIG